jgi:poly(3-hydroxybutyrate) depolymerase
MITVGEDLSIRGRQCSSAGQCGRDPRNGQPSQAILRADDTREAAKTVTNATDVEVSRWPALQRPLFVGGLRLFAGQAPAWRWNKGRFGEVMKDHLMRHVVLAMAVGCVGQAFAADANEFQVFNYYHVDGTGNSVLSMPGRLYVPSDYDPSKTYPMVMFLHGAGEAGSNNTSQVNGNIDNLLAAAKSRDFFLFAPQSGGSAWQSGQVVPAMKMVSMITDQYSIDTSRMYVTGLSYGGGGTWTAIGQYRDVFAAAVPIVASGGYVNPSWLVGKPIWSYEARDDQFLTVGRDAVNAIRAADGGKAPLTFPLNNSPSNPYYNTSSPYYSDGSTFYSENNQRYSEYASGGHSNATWGRAMNEQPMYDWLLSQRNAPHKLQAGEKILVDLGENVSGVGGALAVDANGFTTDSAGRVWNCNSTYKENVTVGPAIAFAKTTAGVNTSITVSVKTPFYGRVTTGVTAGGLYDSLVAVDGWSSSKTVVGSLLFKGLTPGVQYRLAVFGSNTNSAHIGRYTVTDQNGDQYLDLNNVNNASTQAIFQSVIADGQGQFTLTVAPTGTGNYADVNAIELSAVPEPTSLALLGVAALGLVRRRRSV